MSSQSYYSYSRYLKEVFKEKTYKIVVSSGLTCPTRDGTLAKKGCAFCDVRGSSSFHAKKGRGAGVLKQIETRIEPIKERFGAKVFLAYFQSYTNTYSDVETLKELYSAALSHREISGLCVGTRPDCLPDDVILLLEEIAKTHYVSLELGVQSLDDDTLLWLDRGHDAKCSIAALERVKTLAPHVHTCVHLMFGNPTDSPETPKKTALLLNNTGIKGVKLHQLMVLENTVLADRYRENPFQTSSLESYATVLDSFLKHLSPEIYVERLYANATHPDECLAPDWSKTRWIPHNFFRDYFEKTSLKQGELYTS